MEDLKALKFGPVCGKHASCTFYKALKLTKNGKSRVIALGQFFFMKILKGIPVCIGELQLVWEDKTSTQDLTSVRLYFLPECTPEGRQTHHGEDEVLAYSEKIVLKLDDLASLIVEDVSWSEGRRAFTTNKLQPHKEQGDLAESFHMNSFGLDNRDIDKQIEQIEDEVIQDTSPSITVMSYPRYCRYRGILSRLENCTDKWMRHAVVSAIGGFHSANENNRIYFCRDLFDHADLDDFELRCDHLAPNLKGRPRKRQGSKQGNGNDSSEDSNCSTTSSQQENDANKIRTGARATPLRNGFRIDKIKVSNEEQVFLIDLHKFMKSRGTPIGRIPSLGFKQIDLFQFFGLAEEIGGYEQICAKRMWKNIYDALGGNPGSTSAATYTRRHYEKLLLPYERYRKGREIAAHLKKKRQKTEEVMEKKIEDETRSVDKDEEVKENIKKEDQHDPEEPAVNGHSHPAHIKTEAPLSNYGNHNAEMKARALIIKQEIEKMKMRKDAQRHSDKEKVSDKEKMWDERRKNKLGDKVRKPSGCQKTVRELLDQNGRDISDINNDKVSENVHESKIDSPEDKKHVREMKREKSDLKLTDPKVPFSLPQGIDPLAHQALLSPLSQTHPMFYPQLVPMGGALRGVPPMGGALRGVTPMAMPFMIPHVGIQTVANPMQTMHSTGNPTYKDSKPIHALNKLVKEQKDMSKHHATPEHKSAIAHSHSKHKVSNTSPLTSPPTAHSQRPQSRTSPPISQSPSHRPITPAHSNSLKRSYPYMDSKTPPFTSSHPFEHKILSDPSHKRAKLTGSKESSVFNSNSGQLDIPVLDLSMKTLKAQEARQQRGESLLFNTSFNREHRGNPKSRCDEAPQDLSLKSSSRPSSKSSAHDLSLSSHSSHRSTPLNIPQLRSPTDMKSSNFSIPVLSESHKRESVHKTEKQEAMLSPSKLAALGAMPTIGGLPIDLGALVHPAFPQQMLMQGVFPTPMQLQQMIQGQVAAGMSMLHPELIPQSLMLPPSLTSVPAVFSTPSTSVKSSSSTSAGSKR